MMIAANNPAYCANNVPVATPAIPCAKPNTSTVLATMFMMFCPMAMTIGALAFCMPKNQPAKLYNPNTAGAPQIRM